MTTKLQREASAAVEVWCKKNRLKLIAKPRHIHPRAYVIGHAAPRCLIVAYCWADSEPHLRDFDRDNPLKTIHTFDSKLKAGDWCITAYVCTDGRQENVAIPLELK